MNTKKIIFLLPASGSNPVGGVKVVLEYANRLVKDGFNVEIVYAAYNRYSKWGLLHTILYAILFIQAKVSNSWKPKWYKVDERVKQLFVWSHKKYHYPLNAKIIATSLETSVELNEYNIPSENKYYFIQAFENWLVTSDFVYQTFKYKMNKIVISDWLKKEVEKVGEKVDIVYNGFDFKQFHKITPQEERDKFQIAFMYHTVKWKGIKTAFEAFKIVAKKHPEVHLAVFGAMKPQEEFPIKSTFVQSPDSQTFLHLYNSSAIYVAASTAEGWGLTVGEAMQCGCAVACTDNKGYLEMARNGENALVSHVGDAKALAANICKLIEDDNLRIRIAKAGEEYIHNFDIEKSYQKFRDILTKEQAIKWTFL